MVFHSFRHLRLYNLLAEKRKELQQLQRVTEGLEHAAEAAHLQNRWVMVKKLYGHNVYNIMVILIIIYSNL